MTKCKYCGSEIKNKQIFAVDDVVRKEEFERMVTPYDR